MKRFGPLEETPAGLALGDPGRHFLLLTPLSVSHHEREQRLWGEPWEALKSIYIDMPSSRFAFSKAMSDLAYVTLIAAIQDDPGFTPKDGAALVTTRDHAERSLALSPHHFRGYWYRSLESTQKMVNHLLVVPESRTLLSKPGAVIGSVYAAAHAKQSPRSPD